jgi:hypothetical protein
MGDELNCEFMHDEIEKAAPYDRSRLFSQLISVRRFIAQMIR